MKVLKTLVNFPVREASKIMGVSDQFLRVALQRGAVPFGFAIQMNSNTFTYYINPKKFEDYLGINLSNYVEE